MAFESIYPGTYERLPIITNAAHCARALSLVEQGQLYIGLGRKSPWQGENEDGFIPPEPNPDATELDELIGMKKADRSVMVAPDDEGSIEYGGLKWKPLTIEEAFEKKSRWVLVEVTIMYDELPPTAYRQIGIFSRVKTVEGKEGQLILLPDEILDVGILEVLNNRKVVTRQTDTKDTYMMIIEC